MRTIRYIALSDLHLGENNSLLTRVDSAGRTDPSSPSRTMEKLTACIRTLVESNPPDAEKPALILNGDILELALATMDQALAVFGHFLRLLLEPGNLLSEIIHIPGNHDHHLWETARETQYRNYIARLPEGAKPETPWHTTKIVMDMHGEDRLVSDLLTAAARRLAGLGDRAPEILVAYPNYGVLAATGDGTRSALFHHGHFLEDMYAAMSFATTYVNPEYRFPQDVYTLEQENFAWIDFFWSAMGRSGQVGGNIEQLYEVTRDGRRLRAVTDRLAKTIAGRHDIPLLWPDKTEDLEKFYPTGVLITAYDIIFFWVARMVMGGLEFMDEVPFRDVYIHGLVCDDTGLKMDKSRGNIIDPIEMIEKYGADAVRFTMALLATEGQNIRLSPTRFEMGRNFNNKLWNAARFVLMNIPEGDYSFDPSRIADIKDRWIISAFNSTIKKCTESLEKYRYADTANLLYDFVWHSFCDWYVELAKPDLNGEDEERAHLTRGVLAHVLDGCLKMLHPMIPYITEELWRMLGKVCKNRDEGETIMLAPWPKCDESLISEEVEDAFSTLIDITRSIRNIRANLNLPERRPIDVTISAADDRHAEMVKKNQDYFRSMAGVGKIKVGANLERPSLCVVEVVGDTQVFVLLDETNAAAERKKLEKHKTEVEKYLASAEKKLQNKNFVERAKPEVVEQARRKKEELLEQKRIIEENLAALGS